MIVDRSSGSWLWRGLRSGWRWCRLWCWGCRFWCWRRRLWCWRRRFWSWFRSNRRLRHCRSGRSYWWLGNSGGCTCGSSSGGSSYGSSYYWWLGLNYRRLRHRRSRSSGRLGHCRSNWLGLNHRLGLNYRWLRHRRSNWFWLNYWRLRHCGSSGSYRRLGHRGGSRSNRRFRHCRRSGSYWRLRHCGSGSTRNWWHSWHSRRSGRRCHFDSMATIHAEFCVVGH